MMMMMIVFIGFDAIASENNIEPAGITWYVVPGLEKQCTIAYCIQLHTCRIPQLHDWLYAYIVFSVLDTMHALYVVYICYTVLSYTVLYFCWNSISTSSWDFPQNVSIAGPPPSPSTPWFTSYLGQLGHPQFPVKCLFQAVVCVNRYRHLRDPQPSEATQVTRAIMGGPQFFHSKDVGSYTNLTGVPP